MENICFWVPVNKSVQCLSKIVKTVYCDCWHHAVISLAPLSYLDRELSTLSVRFYLLHTIEKPDAFNWKLFQEKYYINTSSIKYYK